MGSCLIGIYSISSYFYLTLVLIDFGKICIDSLKCLNVTIAYFFYSLCSIPETIFTDICKQKYEINSLSMLCVRNFIYLHQDDQSRISENQDIYISKHVKPKNESQIYLRSELPSCNFLYKSIYPSIGCLIIHIQPNVYR